MVWPAIISAGASLLGGAVSAFGQSRAQSRSEDFSREMYEYALTHGPSLEMEGLRRAGINPMLRYGSGGSGTPVSMPTMNFGNAFGDLGSAISGAGSSAFSAMSQQQGIEESKQRIDNLQVDMAKATQEISRIQADTRLTDAQRSNAIAEHDNIIRQGILQLADVALREAQAVGNYAAAEQAQSLAALARQQRWTESFRSSWQLLQNELADNELRLSDLDTDYWLSIPGRLMRGLMLGRQALGIGGGAAGSVGPASVHGSIGH